MASPHKDGWQPLLVVESKVSIPGKRPLEACGSDFGLKQIYHHDSRCAGSDSMTVKCVCVCNCHRAVLLTMDHVTSARGRKFTEPSCNHQQTRLDTSGKTGWGSSHRTVDHEDTCEAYRWRCSNEDTCEVSGWRWSILAPSLNPHPEGPGAHRAGRPCWSRARRRPEPLGQVPVQAWFSSVGGRTRKPAPADSRLF